MISFRVVPLRLQLRGQTFCRGDTLHFDKTYVGDQVKYRLWESRLRRDRKWQYFTQQQLDAMQPGWLTLQEELPL